jgi:hypothetical protein
MSSGAYKKGQKGSQDSGRFIAIPVSVLDSATYQSLGYSSRALLIDIASQFKGENNGLLVACDKFLKPRGWNSKATISKALKELRESGLLIMTRQGMRPNKASYFGISWQGMGSRVIESQLDFNGRTFEIMRHQWKTHERELKIKLKSPKNDPKREEVGSKIEPVLHSASPKNEPISLVKGCLSAPISGDFLVTIG